MHREITKRERERESEREGAFAQPYFCVQDQTTKNGAKEARGRVITPAHVFLHIVYKNNSNETSKTIRPLDI